LFLAVAFYVKFGSDDLLQFVNVILAYVALVRPGMYGDALGAKAFTIFCNLYQIGVVTAAGVT
jgi:hypothetical protein